jgi:isoaspartyl peptidase/L-asparaginase-like protein (Ntn-hydrolase superfamily)
VRKQIFSATLSPHYGSNFFKKAFFRYVMEKTDHTFVVGAGAEELLDRAGLDRVNLFLTKHF